MISSPGARLLLVLGFLAAWIGYDAWIVAHVVLDPDATRAAAHALVETPAVRQRLVGNLTKQLEHQLPGVAKDPKVRAAAAAAVRDPRVATAFADTVATIRAAILTDGSGRATFTVDGRALTAALHDALEPRDPRLAAQVARTAPLTVQLQSKDLPHMRDPTSGVNGLALGAIIAALCLIAASLLVDHERPAIARVGRRTAFLSVTPLLVFGLLPRMLSHFSSDTPEVAGALLRVYGDRVLPSAAALLVIGLVVVVGTVVWPRRAPGAGPGRPRRGPGPRQPDSAQPDAASWPRSTGSGDATAINEKTYL